MSPGRQVVLDAMSLCLKAGRRHQTDDPHRAIKELEKLAVLSDILKSVTNFEMKLVSDMDVD
jgi:hypothetical protein